jgi:hypothetical protein
VMMYIIGIRHLHLNIQMIKYMNLLIYMIKSYLNKINHHYYKYNQKWNSYYYHQMIMFKIEGERFIQRKNKRKLKKLFKLMKRILINIDFIFILFFFYI